MGGQLEERPQTEGKQDVESRSVESQGTRLQKDPAHETIVEIQKGCAKRGPVAGVLKIGVFHGES